MGGEHNWHPHVRAETRDCFCLLSPPHLTVLVKMMSRVITYTRESAPDHPSIGRGGSKRPWERPWTMSKGEVSLPLTRSQDMCKGITEKKGSIFSVYHLGPGSAESGLGAAWRSELPDVSTAT